MPHKRRPQSCRSGLMKAPPGLEDELGLDIAANVDTVDLAKRVERLELLLFLTPEPDIQKINKFVSQVLGDDDFVLGKHACCCSRAQHTSEAHSNVDS